MTPHLAIRSPNSLDAYVSGGSNNSDRMSGDVVTLRHIIIGLNQLGCVRIRVLSSLKQTIAVIDKSLDLEKSREEMAPYFLARSRKLIFHFSFYSRLSRFLEKNSISLLDL